MRKFFSKIHEMIEEYYELRARAEEVIKQNKKQH